MNNAFFYEQHLSAMRVARGQSLTFLPHLHRQAEICLVLTGRQQMTIDGQTRVMEPGEAALVLPNRVHSYAGLEDSEHIIAIVDPSAAGEYAQTLTSSACRTPFVPAEYVHPDVIHCLKRLSGGEALSDSLSRAYMSVTLGRLLSVLDVEPAAASAGQDTASRILRYISEHISEPISLDVLSRKLFINKYSISRIFSEQIGCSLHDYVNAQRVELAQTLLRGCDVPTAELIARCGFESERTFYRSFRQYCGMTPRQYKKGKND